MANGNKLLDQKAIDTIIDSILKAVEIKLNKKSSEGRGKDGKDGRDGKNAPQINDDEALSTNPWSGPKTKEEIAKVEGKIYPCTAQVLEDMTQEQQAELYTQGYRAIKTENNGTVVLLGLSADGNLEWLGCNQPRGNLLDNGNFINPVNQRGVTSALSNSSNYFIDRWMTYQANVNNVTYSLVDNGISLTPVEQGNYAGMQQRIETPLSTGEDYTIIFSVDGDNIVLPVTGGTGKIGEETNNIYLSYVTNYGGYNTVRVVFTTNRSFVVNNARVIKGSYTPKTLPPWEAPDAATEYLKCRRYWRNFDVSNKQLVGICFYPNAVTVLGGVFDIPMRSTPTCSASGVTSINASVRYDVISYIVGSDGLVWIAISNDTPISVGTYVYVWDLRLSSDL